MTCQNLTDQIKFTECATPFFQPTCKRNFIIDSIVTPIAVHTCDMDTILFSDKFMMPLLRYSSSHGSHTSNDLWRTVDRYRVSVLIIEQLFWFINF